MPAQESLPHTTAFPESASIPSGNILLTRRDVLKKMGVVFIGVSVATNQNSSLLDVAGSLYEPIQDMQEAELGITHFVEKNAKRFKNIDFGFSYSPEQLFDLSIENYKTLEGKLLMNKSLDALKFFHEELGMNNIRLGVRWNNIVDKNGDFDLGLYEPFFDYCIENKMDICLNVGIKVFRWPEEHMPTLFSENLPPKNSTLSMESAIAQQYLIWAEKIFSHLQKRYSSEQLSRIKTIQPENEPFNGFGEHKWTMGEDYLLTLTQIAKAYFPKSKILITSSEFSDLDKIYDLFGELASSIDKNQLTAGINYYPFCPSNLIDPLSYYEGEGFLVGAKTLEDFKKQGYNIEVTEAQAEPWTEETPLPESALISLIYVLQRCADRILDPNIKSVLDLWGMEYLYKAPPAISKPIFDLLKNLITN